MALTVDNEKSVEVSGRRKGVMSHLFFEVGKSGKVHEGSARKWTLERWLR